MSNNRRLTHNRKPMQYKSETDAVKTDTTDYRPRVAVLSDDGKKAQYYPYDQFMRFAASNKITLWNTTATSQSTPTFSKFTKTQIVNYLENPYSNEANLRSMSRYLYNISNYYRRLIQYFANMPTFDYVLSPYKMDLAKKPDQTKTLKAYQNAMNAIAIMNIPHEFSKVLNVGFRDDVFYGYCYETKDSFAIQQLDPTYCKITSINDGVYDFAFDFGYFDANKEELLNYAAEFNTKYNAYKSQGSTLRWQELDSKYSICIKINETELTPIPPFVSLFSALADIEDYRAISKNASETSNYKALALEIPTDDHGDFLIDYDLAKEFYYQLEAVLPDNIGLILTPMPISSWDFEKSGPMSDSELVTNAENLFWSQAGVNKLLFGGGDNPSSTTLSLSTVSDQAVVFRVLRQIERWINRKLKNLSGTIKFKLTFLDTTRYNRKEVHDQLLKDGQYGLPVRSAIMATSGIAQTEYLSLSYLENDILGLADYEQPLLSSNVVSQTEEAGRKTVEESGGKISDAGEVSREQN